MAKKAYIIEANFSSRVVIDENDLAREKYDDALEQFKDDVMYKLNNGEILCNVVSIQPENKDISYGELATLQVEFDVQCQMQNIEWVDEEVKQECLNDFISQYAEGESEPKINLHGYGYNIREEQ